MINVAKIAKEYLQNNIGGNSEFKDNYFNDFIKYFKTLDNDDKETIIKNNYFSEAIENYIEYDCQNIYDKNLAIIVANSKNIFKKLVLNDKTMNFITSNLLENKNNPKNEFLINIIKNMSLKNQIEFFKRNEILANELKYSKLIKNNILKPLSISKIKQIKDINDQNNYIYKFARISPNIEEAKIGCALLLRNEINYNENLTMSICLFNYFLRRKYIENIMSIKNQDELKRLANKFNYYENKYNEGMINKNDFIKYNKLFIQSLLIPNSINIRNHNNINIHKY